MQDIESFKLKMNRICAFAMDLFIVLILSSMVSNVYKANPYMYDYEDTYKAFTEASSDISKKKEISSLEDLEVMVKAGASRIGASSGVAIMEGNKDGGNY